MPIKLTITATCGETRTNPEVAIVGLEIPVIAGENLELTPPDAGFFVVKGEEYVLRYR